MANSIYSGAKLTHAEASLKGGGIVSNIPQLQQALREYVKVRNQSTYLSVREKMANIAFKAAQFTEFSDKEKIRSNISNAPALGISSGKSPFIGQYKIINWERKNKGLRPLGNTSHPVVGMKFSKTSKKDFGLGSGAFKTTAYKTKAIKSKRSGMYMDGKYKRFIQARIRSSKWLRIGWALAAAKLGKPFSKGDFGEGTLARLDGKAYGGGASIKKETGSKAEFIIWNGVGVFDHRYKPVKLRPESDVQRARYRQEIGLKKAVSEEIRNMVQLIAERTSQLWYGKKLKLGKV